MRGRRKSNSDSKARTTFLNNDFYKKKAAPLMERKKGKTGDVCDVFYDQNRNEYSFEKE